MTAVLLLAPQTPLLFQGQEFAATSPFRYFNDCDATQQREVVSGRAEFLAQFRSLATPQMQARLPDPSNEGNFRESALDHAERLTRGPVWMLHRDLLRLRREDCVLNRQSSAEIHGAALTRDAYILRYLPPTGATRLLVINFGRTLRCPFLAQPLVAPPAGARWAILWSSEHPDYGGNGVPPLETDDGWYIPAEAAVLLHPEEFE